MLANHGTIAATAAALHLTPSAVSQQIAALAKEIGVPLLARQGRGVRLTPQARVLLDHAAHIQRQLEHARADLDAYHSGQVGQVSIGAFATAISALVAPAMAALRRQRQRLGLRVREVEAPDCFTQLDTGELDLVVTVDYQHGPARADSRYHRSTLLADPFDVALPDTHPFAAKHEPIQLTDLADQPFVTSAPQEPCHAIALSACAASGFAPDIRHYTHDWQAVADLVAAGAGVALIPRLATAHRPLPAGLTLRPITTPTPTRTVYAAVRAGSQHAPTLRAVLEALQTIAASHLGARSHGTP